MIIDKIEPSSLLILFGGSFVAAAISGAAGFGGALLLLPPLTYSMGAEMAVPVLTIAQMIGNLSRVAFGINEVRWKPVGFFLLGAVPMAVLGALTFVQFDKKLITKGIGLALILFVLLKNSKFQSFHPNSVIFLIGGGMTGFIKALPEFERFLEDPETDYYTLRTVVDALEIIKSPESLPLLEKAAQHSNRLIRERAKYILEKSQDENGEV